MLTAVDSTRPQISDERPEQQGLSIVLLCGNDPDLVAPAVRAMDQALAAWGGKYEVLVVTDRATEADWAHTERVRLVQPARPRDRGAALRAGAEAATLGLIAFVDLPCPLSTGQITALIPLAEQTDAVCVYPAPSPGPLWRRLLCGCHDVSVALLTGTRAHSCGHLVKVFRRDRLASILPDSEGAFADTELFARARALGLNVTELGSPAQAPPEGPAAASPRNLSGSLAALLRFWWSSLLFPARHPAAAPKDWSHAGQWLAFLLVALLAGALLLLNLSYPLLEPDEGRYAEVTRKMLDSGEWLWPSINHQPFFDKPPLFYWLVAGSFRAFGTTPGAARLVPALGAFLTVLALFWFVRRSLGTRPAFLASLALSLMVGFILCGRIVILDSLLTLFVALAILCGHEAMRPGRSRGAWWLASILASTLGALIKGPIALVLVVPPLAAHAWLTRDPRSGHGARRLTIFHWIGYVAAVVLLSAPTFVLVSWRDPRFAHHFFVDQHLVRFFLNEYHVEPKWYFVPVLLVMCLPWSALLVPAVRFLLQRSPEVRALRSEPMGLYLLWAAWCLFFFTMSKSKLPPYILPAFPALAALIGCYLDRALFSDCAALFGWARQALPRVTAIVLANLWLAAAFVGLYLGLFGPTGATIRALVATGCGLAVFLGWRRLSVTAAWLTCALLGSVVAFEAAHELVPAWAQMRSPIARAGAAVAPARSGEMPVVVFGGEWGSVPFDLGRDDTVRNFTEQSPQELERFLLAYPRYFLVVRHRDELDYFRGCMLHRMGVSRIVDAGEVGMFSVTVEPLPGLPSPSGGLGPGS